MLSLKKLLAVIVMLAVVTMLLTPQGSIASTVSKETLELIKKAGGTEQFPDANAIVILSKSDIEYDSEGKSVAQSYGLIKVLTEAGKNDCGEKRAGYYKAYDTVRVVTARVIKQDGSVVDVPDDMIKDINSTASEQMNIYEPESKEKVITFKNLEVGDCVEYLLVDSTFHTPMDGEFDGMDIFQDTDPIILKQVTVIGPKGKPLRYLERNGKVPFEQRTQGDKVVYTWKVENVARIVAEPAMPSFIDVAPTVVFTTIKSWEDISRWWNGIAESKYAMSPAMIAEEDSLLIGKTTRDEKIDAIYRYASQKIRYMGLGTGKKKGFEPKPANETWETKYGVCRDIAAMTVAMLRHANIESEIVLTGVGYEVPRDIPNISFNHAIVAIKNADGTYAYADPTLKNSTDLLSAAESDQQVLLCTKTGNTLTDTPHAPAEKNMGTIKAESNLTESGIFTSDVTLSTQGLYDLALRSWAMAVPAAQMSMLWSYLIADVYPGIKLTGFSFSDPNDLTKPFEIKFSYQIDSYPMEAGQFTLMKSPVSLGAFEIISKLMFASASLPERKYPWVLGFTFGASEEETINLPPGLQIKSMPDPISKTLGPVEYKMTYSSTSPKELSSGGLQVTYQKRLLVESKQMSPAEYAQFKQILLASSKAQRGELIMVKDKEN
jgi:hypothetical protein